MPTYDYACRSCNRDFTVMQKIADPAPVCPHCGAESVTKKLSAPAVHGRSSHSSPPAAGHGCGMGGCGCKH
ncbi:MULTISPECIES: FmdB family zinc ribbon protein [Methylococcus]|uniref:Zinc ribbon domain-containing protein n=1 Tax=Methylococcus capsulatus TaxID=414 RepID=A0ABZ2F4H3_METCP|nr:MULTISPECIES: zinc ribbon domain-containing protein [Methylococcus]MDF9391921.1 zinc ribbon domain-containing protein [Methylococcus capsulatus]